VLFSLAVISTGVLLQVAFAGTTTSCLDECRDILRSHYKVFKFNSAQSYKHNLVAWLRSATEDDIYNAVSTKVDLGYDGLSIGGSKDSESYRRLRQAIDSGRIENISEDRAMSFFYAAPDEKSVEAWKICMREKNPFGMSYSEQRSGDHLILSIKWRPFGGGTTPLKFSKPFSTNCVLESTNLDPIAVNVDRTFQFRIIDQTKAAYAHVPTEYGLASAQFIPPPPPKKIKSFTIVPEVQLTGQNLRADYHMDVEYDGGSPIGSGPYHGPSSDWEQITDIKRSFELRESGSVEITLYFKAPGFSKSGARIAAGSFTIDFDDLRSGYVSMSRSRSLQDDAGRSWTLTTRVVVTGYSLRTGSTNKGSQARPWRL
jgi:hypothetical protein